jgi:hypothetical protein
VHRHCSDHLVGDPRCVPRVCLTHSRCDLLHAHRVVTGCSAQNEHCTERQAGRGSRRGYSVKAEEAAKPRDIVRVRGDMESQMG